MKKNLFYLFLMLILIFSVGCKNISGEGAGNDKEPNGSVNEIEENEPVEEPKDTDTEEPVEEPEGENPESEEVTEEETEGTIVTDEAAIYGMARDILKNMTLEEKIGQMFIVNLEALDQSKGNYYEFRKITKEMKKNLEKYQVGGVAFFARNIETREQTVKFIEKLQTASNIPLFISVDEEGGDVARIGSNDNMQTTKFPTMKEIGEMEDEQYVYDMGETIGKEIKELGFNLNFAPVADVITNELNTEIGSRSFGSDPKKVSKMVKQMVNGLQDQNVSATLKHFPGHGDVSEDSHNGAVNVDNDIIRLREVEFLPFSAGIKAGVDFIMISHISISRITESTTPASLSELVLKDILRVELGYQGLAITDAMDMKSITDHYSPKKAAVQAISAGADIVLMPEDLEAAYNGVLEAVEKGEISEVKIDDTVERILMTKIRRGVILSNTDLIVEETEE